MLEMIVFAVTLVVAQCVAGFVMLRLTMNKKFIKKYVKMATETSMELAEELLGEDEDED